MTIPSSPTSPTSLKADQKRFRRPTTSRNRKSPQRSEPPRGLLENRKLLAHLLDKLENRQSGPDLLQLANDKAIEGSSIRRNKDKGTIDRIGKVVVAAAHSGISVGQGPIDARHGRKDENDEDGDAHDIPSDRQSTEAVFDLIDQTRGLLVLAHRQGLDLFEDADEIRYEPYTPSKPKNKGGRLSALTSPITTKRPTSPRTTSHAGQQSGTVSASVLHHRLIIILREIILDDCLHQIGLFRPSRPPNALQAACLDIATLLYYAGDFSTKIQIASLVTDGLYTMPASMKDRLCLWIEGRLGELLVIVAERRGLPVVSDSASWTSESGSYGVSTKSS